MFDHNVRRWRGTLTGKFLPAPATAGRLTLLWAMFWAVTPAPVKLMLALLVFFALGLEVA